MQLLYRTYSHTHYLLQILFGKHEMPNYKRPRSLSPEFGSCSLLFNHLDGGATCNNAIAKQTIFKSMCIDVLDQFMVLLLLLDCCKWQGSTYPFRIICFYYRWMTWKEWFVWNIVFWWQYFWVKSRLPIKVLCVHFIYSSFCIAMVKYAWNHI